MSVNIGTLHRKRTVYRFDGSIRDLLDETDGGWIIRNGIVVNQEKIDEMARKEADRKVAAQAQNNAVTSIVSLEERNVTPSKMEELEKKVESMEGNIAQILMLLQKK